MTNEQLTAYLQDETYLYSVSYEELKTLVMQYPYAANLRVLLLKKSYLDQNKDYDRNLQMSATYTTNRKHLYKTIKKLKSFKLAPQNVILGEDFLELTELSNIERLLADRHVTEIAATASIMESLGSDWQLEIDDIAFNEDPEKPEESFDLSHLSENLDNHAKKSRAEEDEIDSLISSLVSQYRIPALDLSQEDLGVSNENDLEEQEETPPIAFENLEDPLIEVPSVKDLLTYEDTHRAYEKEFDDTIFNFMDEEEGIIKEDDIIIEAEIKKISEKEDFELSSNLFIDLVENKTPDQISEDTESIDNVKKTDIELEIINQTKAPIVETPVDKQPFEKKPSFTEWLSQFRMTKSAIPSVPTIPIEIPIEIPTQKPIEKPIEKIAEDIGSQVITPAVPNEHIRKISQKNMLDLFETQNDVPDNLFGLVGSKEAVHFIDDDDDDDEVFSEYESRVSKKQKMRPMHQLAVKSLIQDDELVSETLADLLSWQGNSVKAIEMYRKLILRFPEKSSYFATKIEKIS